MTDRKFPSRITISDEGIRIDGKDFPYFIADPDDEGFQLIENSHAGDDSKRLVLKLMFVPGMGPEDTTVVDTRASQADRRRELAKTWHKGWIEGRNHDSGSVPATFITSDHEAGLAWRSGFTYGYTSDERGNLENPYRLANEGPNGEPEGMLL